jgi:hypothetical protein
MIGAERSKAKGRGVWNWVSQLKAQRDEELRMRMMEGEMRRELSSKDKRHL